MTEAVAISRQLSAAEIQARLGTVSLDAATVRGQTPDYAQQIVPGLPSGIPTTLSGHLVRNTYVNSLFRV